MIEVIVIAHNIRSVHNIGSIFRTAEGFGVSRLVLSGYSPYPEVANDSRLPHLVAKQTAQIHKTALGAETILAYEYQTYPDIDSLRSQGYVIVGLEQDQNAISLEKYNPPEKIALLLGEEVTGITTELLRQCDELIEIPMTGKKESFNVSVATGIALYGLMCKS